MTVVHVLRGHITATVAAELMGVSRQRVHQLLTQGRVPGAFLVDCGDGREMWVIPRPAINRIKFKKRRNGAKAEGQK